MLAPSLQTVLTLTQVSVAESATVNVQTVDRLAMQVNATDATPGADTFLSSDVTASIRATGTITVTDYTALVGKTITIGAVTITEGSDFTASTSNDSTATSIASATVTGYTLSALAAVVTVQPTTYGASVNGTTITTNSTAAVTLVNFAGGADGLITITAHGYNTGMKVALSGSNLPGGLSATNYYIIRLSANTLALASSNANAVAGTEVQMTTVGSTGTKTLTPASFGSVTLEMKASLDGVNYFSFGTPKTITISGTGNQYLDCGQVSYPSVKISTTAPTAGALTATILLYGMDTQVQMR